jgi:hypothetical protein
MDLLVTIPVCWLSLMACCIGMAGEAKLHNEGELVLFRKPLEQDREIVVLREPDGDANRLRGVMDPRLLEQATAVYAIRLELWSPGQSPMLLAVRVRVETMGPELGVEILDVLADSHGVVVALAEGPDIGLWRVEFGLGSSVDWAPLHVGDWAIAAPLRPLGRRQVKVNLERADNRLAAEVTDLRARRPQAIRFEQVADTWVFEPTEQ